MIIKKKTEPQIISLDTILLATNNGLDIYKKELDLKYVGGNWKCCCPFHNEKSPSFVFNENKGVIKCFGCGKGFSNPIAFIMERYNLDYKKAIEHITSDIRPELLSNKIDIVRPTIDKKYLKINFSVTPFNKAHHKYFNDYHLTEDFLKKSDVFRVKDLWIGGRKIKLRAEELTYAYYHRPSDKCKILRIGVPKDDKWRTNVSGETLWFKENYTECDKLLISKAIKDALCLKLFDICSVATQNESDSSIKSNIDWINSCGREIFLNFGSDEEGKKMSHQITKTYNFKHYNTPDKFLGIGCNDFAELVKYDIKEAEKHLKLKKII